jgi:hypothetical protein
LDATLGSLNDEIWAWQHWRGAFASADLAAAALAPGLLTELASWHKRKQRLARNPGYVMLVPDSVSPAQSMELARAFAGAFDAAKLDAPGELAADLRQRVAALHLA